MAKLKPQEPDRVLIPGKPAMNRCDNQVISARYTALTFLPVAVTEQFRRFANLYFLIIGFIMAIGYYIPSAFESAISPWTTLGPLALVITFSLLVEGIADLKRHRNDDETNNAKCVILRRTDELDVEDKPERDDTVVKGKDVVVNINKAFYDGSKVTGGAPTPTATSSSNNVAIAFQKVRRMDIRQGHFVLVKNREMVPADILLLASSNDHGSAYIETSSIDGETNLKLRTSPHLPKNIIKALRDGTPMESIEEGPEEEDHTVEIESIADATKRITRFSYLGRPGAMSALLHPDYEHHGEAEHHDTEPVEHSKSSMSAFFSSVKDGFTHSVGKVRRVSLHRHSNRPTSPEDAEKYIAALTTEAPNPSVHTFSGKLTFPPFATADKPHDIPLDSENVLLRGAVIRNTEWVIGVAFFTGTDTKLVQNSFKTKSKFSQLDRLMNYTVVAILCIMFICIVYLASRAVITTNDNFDGLWYVGFSRDATRPWPYLPQLENPQWVTKSQNWIQYFFLYVTLLNNFVPLSLYITVEFITFCMLGFIYADVDMYDDTTNTRAVARSTIVSDLGRIQYIFSDKTGTLTQNVMRFKRCSVDGLVFGAPIQKTRPHQSDDTEERASFYPLRQLLVGQFKAPRAAGLEGLGDAASPDSASLSSGELLTFNAEMFLRVMSLCHTVVVEKDIDKKTTIDSSMSINSTASNRKSLGISLFGRKRANTADSLPPVAEEDEFDANGRDTGMRGRTSSVSSLPPGQTVESLKGSDGAPYGFAYQAESPDEGALVSVASSTYGFQVVSRDSSGIRLRLTSSSHLRNRSVTSGLRSGSLTLSRLAAESSAEIDDEAASTDAEVIDSLLLNEPREETWAILAVNKFDSDRKRMSILLRSPRELGDLPILFCKGADNAMLDPMVCNSKQLVPADTTTRGDQFLSKPINISHMARDVSALTTVSEGNDHNSDDGMNRTIDEEAYEMAQMLGLQSHLGDFASEGLRTLVLGMRILSEDECQSWLEEYKAAATSMQDRAALLTKAAMKIERGLHIVGATAIEDKLQKKVPETIATLSKAGIKLWVLTGDKRETAVEIGYSTNVLTPKMHLTEVADNGKLHVCTQMSMEFIRLIKLGKLVEYQKSALEDKGRRTFQRFVQDCLFSFGKYWRSFKRFLSGCIASFYSLCGCTSRAQERLDDMAKTNAADMKRLKKVEMRRKVRRTAEKIIEKWLNSEEGQKHRRTQRIDEDEISLTSEETPAVFTRASSAKSLLKEIRSTGKISASQLREISLAQLTVQQAGDEEPFVDEDALSMDSFFPGNLSDIRGDFDKKKRTVLERLFAIDHEVRKGQLTKHVRKERLEAISEAQPSSSLKGGAQLKDGPRALVIEGDALKHLLGDQELEAILFAVASNCDAVIACRVSPKQKALLLNLVRHNVKPQPITLAIGDGANDVGMIQEAHVGVGISGKEGKQAVNASDFAIAQFRFLEDLILVHGRWNFFRLSTVVLFSFYKNAIMACILITFAPQALYSGTPLFDQWLIAMLNFVAGVPIIVLGLFDRCLSKDYVKRHPEVYKATRNNELITFRTLLRWIFLVLVHTFTLYYFTVPQQSLGGGMTSAFVGLMRNTNPTQPGDGEGGDLESVGTVTFSSMVILLMYKVLYESKSLVHGVWPALRGFCRREGDEGFFSRLAYTWIGSIGLSLGFYLVAISAYSALGRLGPSEFSQFTAVTKHVLGTRSLSWMLMVFVPIAGITFDLVFKVFSNMYYPTQTQIHLEIEAREKAERRRRRLLRASSWRRTASDQPAAEP